MLIRLWSPRLPVWLAIALLLSGCGPAPQLSALSSDSRILAFGDSLTYGTGAARELSYPAQLAKLTGIEVINAGLPGENSASGLQRLPRLLQQYQPDVLILCHGGNDILRRMPLADTVSNLQAMIELARAQNVEVVLIAVPEFGIMLATANFYSELATQYQLPVEDKVLSKILRQPALKSDQIHPNAAGYALLAEAMANLLAATGAIKAEK